VIPNSFVCPSAVRGSAHEERVGTEHNGAPQGKAAIFFQIALLQGKLDECHKMIQQKELEGDAAIMGRLNTNLGTTEERIRSLTNQLVHLRRTNYYGSWDAYA
jgi:hypothetical protein